MSQVIYSYNGNKTTIFCDVKDKLKDINKKFLSKTNSKHATFLYNEMFFNEDMTFNELINEVDKSRNCINIKVDKLEYLNSNKQNSSFCDITNDKDYKIIISDINGYLNGNIIFDEFEDSEKENISKISCDFCDKKKSETFQNKFFFCINCHKNICPVCKYSHDKSHIVINYEKKYYYCNKHSMPFNNYCKNCNHNICVECQKEHQNHELINLGNILIEKENMLKEINEFQNKLNEIIKKLNDTKNNLGTYYDIIKNKINIQEIQKNELIKNINELINYKNSDLYKNRITISKNSLSQLELKEKEKEKEKKEKEKEKENEKKKEKEMEKEKEKPTTIQKSLVSKTDDVKPYKAYSYEEKLNYTFKHSPENLKYKCDIINSNDYFGVNDIFEVFISYKDNKEYLASKNVNFNIDIVLLSDCSKVKILTGHKGSISTVRYFINKNNHNEYLISADEDKIVIVWDITNDYHIKHKIKTYYKNIIDSCLLTFINNQNYIITSSVATIGSFGNDDSAATKVFSLENKEFIKYISYSKNYRIYYLLLWYNKYNNDYNIIQLADSKILVCNLFEDKLYAELKHEPESLHYSGCLIEKSGNDYLCSSSENGYIKIWDLYKKCLFQTIQTNNFRLYLIIEWNPKYIIVGDQKSFIIIDSDEYKVISVIEGKCKDVVRCIKKINHPVYGESLLVTDDEYKIKLWSIN